MYGFLCLPWTLPLKTTDISSYQTISQDMLASYLVSLFIDWPSKDLDFKRNHQSFLHTKTA